MSPLDTGTDPLDPDSDGDGFDDGSEVTVGSDPTDPASVPPVRVPALPPGAPLVLALGLGIAAWRLSRRRRI